MADMPDTISMDQFDAGSIEPQAAPKPMYTPQPGAPQQSNPDTISIDQFNVAPDESQQIPGGEENKHGTLGQQALTAEENLERGLTFGLSDLAQSKMREFASKAGVPNEYLDYIASNPTEMAARNEENPVTAGAAKFIGQMASLGIAPAALGIAPEATIGAAALRGAITGGIIAGGDEISNSILQPEQHDAGDAVSSSLAHVGAGILLGAATGGLFFKGMQALDAVKQMVNSSKFMADFGNRWRFNVENPELSEAVHNELNNLYTTTKDAVDETYGVTGLKAQAIQKLVPEMNENIVGQSQNIANRLESKIQQMAADTDTYPARLTNRLQQDTNQWMEAATNPNASSNDVFNATQELKQKLQSYAKFDKSISAVAPERGFVDAAKELQYGLRTDLEDSSVWGKAADLQKGINKSFSRFKDPLDDFTRRFTTKVEGEPVLDPGKINTYINQIGKPSATIKQTYMNNFIKSADAFRNEVANLHATLGVDSTLEPLSLNATKSTLGQATKGAKLADFMQKVGMPNILGTIPGRAAAAKAGAVIGGPVGGLIGYHLSEPFVDILENTIGKRVTGSVNKYMLPATLRVLSNPEDIGGLMAAQEYAQNVGRGAIKISDAVKNVLQSGVGGINNEIHDRDREKLKQYIESGKFNTDMQDAASKANPSAPPQAFAEGGIVTSVKPPNNVPSPTNHDQLAKSFPTHSMMLSAARGRINNYLNSVRPQVSQGLMYDSKPTSKLDANRYENAIDLAIKPLKILDKVKSGSVTMDDLQHFNGMYPELHQHLIKKLTQEMAQRKLDAPKEKPNYKTRQALAMFLGQPLDSTMSPASIQAAQSVFLPQAAQQQSPQAKTKRGTSTLGKQNKSYQTLSQSAESDRNTRK